MAAQPQSTQEILKRVFALEKKLNTKFELFRTNFNEYRVIAESTPLHTLVVNKEQRVVEQELETIEKNITGYRHLHNQEVNKEQRITQLEQELQKQVEEYRRLHNLLGDRNLKITQLEQELKEKNHDYRCFQSLIVIKEERISQLEQELETTQKKNKDLEENFMDLEKRTEEAKVQILTGGSSTNIEGSARRKMNDSNKVESLVATETSEKKRAKKVLLKKLVNLKNNSHKESENVKYSEASSTKVKGKYSLKGNKVNTLNMKNKLEHKGKSFMAAPESFAVTKQKNKKKRFKKMTNEVCVLGTEINLLPSKEANLSEIPKPNASKATTKKRKHLHRETAESLLKSTCSNLIESTGPVKQRKLKDEIHTPIENKSTYTMRLQKSPYNSLKLKEIFAKTPLGNHEKKNKKAAITLHERMVQKLQASHFRFLNEQLYTTDPKEVEQLFRSDPEAFRAYHEGYQKQVQQWPINPLDFIIKSLKQQSPELVIADFGCGDAQLACSLPNQVHSFDFIAISDKVVACNMAHTPLSNASVDVVVFCLSLMGTSLPEFFCEANRVLKEGGIMKIAEVESRFDSVEEFVRNLHKFGFVCTWKDLSHKLFYFLDFKKELNIKKKMKKHLPEVTLKPCLYKKR